MSDRDVALWVTALYLGVGLYSFHCYRRAFAAEGWRRVCAAAFWTVLWLPAFCIALLLGGEEDV